MDRELYTRVSEWFDAHAQEMVQDIMRIVRIPSVSAPGDVVKPFGKSCRDCLDEMLAIGREHGFYTENYDYYVGSIGEEKKCWENMIGLWNHLDVVPAGENWQYAPFEPELKGSFLFGRGAQDNKGPAIGMLYVMQCIRELQIPMEHQLCLFVGCDEERGMEDLAYYAEHYPLPGLSMIADSAFPVCYGEKGIMEGEMISPRPFSAQVRECFGGSASNMVPGSARVRLGWSRELEREITQRLAEEKEIFRETDEEGIILRASGVARHSAFPEGSVNAVYELVRFLTSLETLDPGDREIFRQLERSARGCHGESLQIAYTDGISGATTCVATMLRMEEGCAALHYNIRYAITQDSKELERKLCQAAEKYGMGWRMIRNSAPSYFPKEHPAVALLTDLYNELTGQSRESFTMGGGTYARRLPDAFAYGVGGMAETTQEESVRKELLRPGCGGAHEPDECLNVRALTDALKIYVMALVEMNRCSL